MSLNYDLELCTGMSAEEVRDLMLTLAAGIEQTDEPEILVGPGATIFTLPESELGKELTREKYGLDPTVHVIFRLDKFGAFDEGVITAVKVSLQLLKITKSDGLFLTNGDTPVLMRRAGEITLDPGPGFWTGLPALVGHPHSVAPLLPFH